MTPAAANPEQPCFNDDSDGFVLPSPNCNKNGCSTSGDSSSAFIAVLGSKDDLDTDVVNYVCGGSLITRRHVVSAATCHDPIKAPIIEVRVGLVKLSNLSGKLEWPSIK